MKTKKVQCYVYFYRISQIKDIIKREIQLICNFLESGGDVSERMENCHVWLTQLSAVTDIGDWLEYFNTAHLQVISI